MRVPLDLRKSYRLINHGPVTLVTSRGQDRPNVMAASWVVPVDFDPARVALVIGNESLTFENIMSTGELVINVPTVDMLEAVYEAGNTSGREVDKLERLGLPLAEGSKVRVPLIESCVGWMECLLIRDDDLQRKHGILLAEVIAAWVDDEVYRDGKWSFKAPGRRTMHHLSGSTFFATGDRLEAVGKRG